MPPKGHALLGASGAHRWLQCPPSARLEENYPDKGSSFAAEGSLAHELAELKVRQFFSRDLSQRAVTMRHNKLKKAELYQPEMERYTDAYLDFVREQALTFSAEPFVMIEAKVDFSGYVPEGYGTADCILVSGDTIHVIDFKYGKGVPVSAEHNPQMQLYAIGAIGQMNLLFDIQRVVLSIMQPRIDNISSWETSADDLYKWAAVYVQPRAKMAYDGVGEFYAGDHCRFCRARGECRARAVKEFESLEQEYLNVQKTDPALLTAAQIADLLKRAEPYRRWLEDIQAYALTRALAGDQYPGWKLVEGTSRRRFDDADAALRDLIDGGIDESILYERRPLSLAAIEKTLGHAMFDELCGRHVIKPAGKPTLVPESDKRPVYSPAESDFKDIIKF